MPQAVLERDYKERLIKTDPNELSTQGGGSGGGQGGGGAGSTGGPKSKGNGQPTQDLSSGRDRDGSEQLK